MASPRLVNKDLQDRLDKYGFCTAPLLDSETCRALTTQFYSIVGEGHSGFLSTALQLPALRRAAHHAILPHLIRALVPRLTGFRTVLCSFVARFGHSDQDDLPLHQDWTFVDERVARSISLWVPLQAVDSHNGCMTVVPGSHRHDQPARAIGSGFRYRSVEAELRAQHLVDVPMAAGEAMLFDHRLIHGSRCNAGTSARLAVGAVLLPDALPLFMAQLGKGEPLFEERADSFLLDADLLVV